MIRLYNDPNEKCRRDYYLTFQKYWSKINPSGTFLQPIHSILAVCGGWIKPLIIGVRAIIID